MADKLLKINASGILEQQEVTVVSTGVAEAGDPVGLDANGKLDTSVMPTGIGADTAVIVAGENLAAGDFVNIYDASGTPTVRKAIATGEGTRAHGFVLAAVTSGQNATVYFEGGNNQVTGKTGGTNQFLSAATAGATTSTAPSAATNIVQGLGVATSATAINVEISQPVVLA